MCFEVLVLLAAVVVLLDTTTFPRDSPSIPPFLSMKQNTPPCYASSAAAPLPLCASLFLFAVSAAFGVGSLLWQVLESVRADTSVFVLRLRGGVALTSTLAVSFRSWAASGPPRDM